jgi:tetratricopeptide (TPR) repeat protein
MSSFEPHRTLKPAASLAVAVWVAAPGVGFSQAELELVANDEAQQRIFDAIAAAESSDGQRSVELIGPYTELAMLYLEARDYDLALAAMAQALHVVRVNFGLYSLEQAPLLRLSGRIEEARGDPAAAWTLEQEVLALARRNPNELDTIPILRELADRRGGFFGMQYRAEAINVLLRNELYTSDELRTLEMELVRDSLPYGPSRTLVRGRAYEIGRDSLRRLAAYSNVRAEPLLARVDALVAIADWDLLFKEKGSALEIYEEAYALLKQNGVEQSAIDRIFAPTIPIALPAFRWHPLYSSEPTADSTGYVEVAFEIGKYGVASGVEVLDTSTSSNETVERNFVNWVRDSRFRPRVVGDKIARNAPVVARYYVNDQR